MSKNSQSEVATLKIRIAALNELRTVQEGHIGDLKARIATLEKDNAAQDGTIERITTDKNLLKKHIAALTEETAQLRGYIDRVIEDDAVREIGAETAPVPVAPPRRTRFAPEPYGLPGYDVQDEERWGAHRVLMNEPVGHRRRREGRDWFEV